MYSDTLAIFLMFLSVTLRVHEEQGVRHRVVGAQRQRTGIIIDFDGRGCVLVGPPHPISLVIVV